MTRWLLRVLAVAVLTLGLMVLFGQFRFSDAMTGGLVRFADRLGVHGDEGIEDLYVAVTAAISLALALLIVAAAERRRSAGRRLRDGR